MPRLSDSIVFGALLVSALVGTGGVADAQASVTSIGGVITGDGFASLANSISDDGAVVTGIVHTESGNEAFRWTKGSGFELLSDLPAGRFSSKGNAISGDGRFIVGDGVSGDGFEGFRWDASTGIEGLGDFPDPVMFRSYAKDVSNDGSVIVGSGWSVNQNEAFIWSRETGLIGLGDLPGGEFRSDATAVSADGSVVVGLSSITQGKAAFRWTESEGMVALDNFDTLQRNGGAHGISDDGQVVVGYSLIDVTVDPWDPMGLRLAAMWNTDGTIVPLDPNGEVDGVYSEARAANADGSVIVGHKGNEAFIWTKDDGFRMLADVLLDDHGIDLSGWNLFRANDLSADGNFILIDAFSPDGVREGLVVALPAPATSVLLVAAGFFACRPRRD